jgi:hypothetical protein
MSGAAAKRAQTKAEAEARAKAYDEYYHNAEVFGGPIAGRAMS